MNVHSSTTKRSENDFTYRNRPARRSTMPRRYHETNTGFREYEPHLPGQGPRKNSLDVDGTYVAE